MLSKDAAAEGKAQFEVDLARVSSDSELASVSMHEIEYLARGRAGDDTEKGAGHE